MARTAGWWSERDVNAYARGVEVAFIGALVRPGKKNVEEKQYEHSSEARGNTRSSLLPGQK